MEGHAVREGGVKSGEVVIIVIMVIVLCCVVRLNQILCITRYLQFEGHPLPPLGGLRAHRHACRIRHDTDTDRGKERKRRCNTHGRTLTQVLKAQMNLHHDRGGGQRARDSDLLQLRLHLL